MKRRILLALLVLLLLAMGGVAGCRRATPAPQPPAEETSTVGQPPTTPTTPTRADAVGYFMSGEKVQPVRLPGVDGSDLQAVVEALVAGVPAEAAAYNLVTTIPPGTRVNKVAASGDEVVVDLSSEFGSGGGSLSMQARVAQVVFTLTRDPQYRQVRFLIDGKAVDSLGGEGVMIAAPQSRETWETLSPVVLVESPVLGDTVTNPLTVTGTANTFEAEFNLELTDGDGIIVAKRNVMATSGSGTRGTFEADLDFSSAKPGVGEIIASYDSAKDGSKVVVSEIVVKFP